MRECLRLTDNFFDTDGYFRKPIELNLEDIDPIWINIFDQNGYILTTLEQQYYKNLTEHRGPWEHSYQKPWFTQEQKYEGAVLNHSMILQRKGFADEAYDQLCNWAKVWPIIYKVAKIRPKWGLDFSIDWTDKEGNVFEILHWEWDSFDLDTVQERKYYNEQLFEFFDWEHVAKQMLLRKDQWYHLDFFGQSAWKCDFIGIEHEQFKMVCWT